jgi:hypothetical protein
VDAQGRGQPNYVPEADVTLTTLHTTHIGSMDPDPSSQGFLAEAGLLSKSPNALTKGLERIVPHQR